MYRPLDQKNLRCTCRNVLKPSIPQKIAVKVSSSFLSEILLRMLIIHDCENSGHTSAIVSKMNAMVMGLIQA